MGVEWHVLHEVTSKVFFLGDTLWSEKQSARSSKCLGKYVHKPFQTQSRTQTAASLSLDSVHPTAG